MSWGRPSSHNALKAFGNSENLTHASLAHGQVCPISAVSGVSIARHVESAIEAVFIGECRSYYRSAGRLLSPAQQELLDESSSVSHDATGVETRRSAPIRRGGPLMGEPEIGVHGSAPFSQSELLAGSG